jgi:hypothetical protein
MRLKSFVLIRAAEVVHDAECTHTRNRPTMPAQARSRCGHEGRIGECQRNFWKT